MARIMPERTEKTPLMETSFVAPSGQKLWIRRANIFNGRDARPFLGDVRIESGRIAAVSPSPLPADDPDTTIVDAAGRFLMPGMIDAHWHACMAANTMTDLLTADEGYTQIRAAREAERTLLRGFTTIRDAGGPVFGLKRAIDEGICPGPRIFPCGSLISQTGGHGDFRAVYDIPHPFDCCALTHTERLGAATLADGADAVTAAARNNLRLGASQLKLMAGGGAASLYDRLEDTQFFEEEIRAAVKAAEDAGTYVMVHVYVPAGIQRAVAAGVRSIEHGHLIDEATMRLLADKGVWLCMQPFAAGDNVFPSEEQRRKHMQIVEGTDRTYRWAKQYGVKLAWGTDLLFDPAGTDRENDGIGKLAQWFSNLEILRMITSGNAELLALSGRRNPYPAPLGVIAPGAWGDLLLVEGDPLKDISVLTASGKHLSLIVKNGRIYKNELFR